MDCRKFQKNLEDYLEGGLDFPGRFGMERHAQQCYGCGAVISGAQKLSQKVRELERVSAPPDFEAAVLNRISASGGRSRFRFLRRIWAYGFDYPSWRVVTLGATAALLLGFGIFFTSRWILRENAASDSSVAGNSVPAAGVPNMMVASGAGPSGPSSGPVEAGSRRPAPASLTSPRIRKGFPAQEDGFSGQIEPSEYVDFLVPGLGDRSRVVRLPNTIRMTYGQPSEEYFIRNVSH